MPSKPSTKSQKPAAAASAAARSSKKETKVAAPVTPATAAPVAAEPQNEVEDKTAIQRLEEFSQQLLADFNKLSADYTALRNRFRAYNTSVLRELKTAQKQSKKTRRQPKGDRAPSGFVKPALISNELAAFLKVKAGTMMARTEVTKAINAYVKTHNLKDKNNGRIIQADAALSKLLKLKSGDELTYFNLQRYMTPHFSKAEATA
jgi:upstream activation factor subunit UAF30